MVGRASSVKILWMMISLDGVASSQIVNESASVIFPLHHKIQKMPCKNIIVGYHPMGALTLPTQTGEENKIQDSCCCYIEFH